MTGSGRPPRLLFYAPFKPLDHPRPSGDQTIGRYLHQRLAAREFEVKTASRLRCRWIFWRPWRFPAILAAYQKSLGQVRRFQPDLWLTYHTYYKAPDVLGPLIKRKTGLPYVIFQGSYATKYRKKWRTRPGFYLNRRALAAADHVFVNRRADEFNLKRLIPESRITYVPPGIDIESFRFDPSAREELRRAWGMGEGTVALTAAMFRPGVKMRGLAWVIRACGRLARSGVDLRLAVAGDGEPAQRRELRDLAQKEAPGRVVFVGLVERADMHRFYSAGDFFAFPGFDESLGMVYLEAQSCGLAVVAQDDGGVAEVVKNGTTGFLTRVNDLDEFTLAAGRLAANPDLRRDMGRAAARYVRQRHDQARNYDQVADRLTEMARRP